MEKIRLGIIGLGNMGTSHARNVNAGKCPDFVLTAISDINPDRVAWGKENLPETITYFEDATAMLDSGLIDACIIAVPHYDHPRYAMECMQRSIHVMVEKPAGVYTKQVREMNEEAARHPEVKFGMMFNQRTDHIYRKMRELVQSGKYGEIRRVNWLITNWYRTQAYYDSGSWRATWSGEGGGVLLNQCPHNLDLWQWICGMPARVHSHILYGKWHDIEVEDDVTTYVEYPNGATGVFITTTGDAHGTNRFEIQLDKAKIVADNGQLTVLEYDVSVSEFTKGNASAFTDITAHPLEIVTDGKSEQHIGVLNAWADAILRGGEMIAHGEEGINGLTLSNAMHLSSFLGKTIELPLDEDLFYEELMKRVAASKPKEEKAAVFSDTSNSYNGSK